MKKLILTTTMILSLATVSYGANVTDGQGNTNPGTIGQLLVNDNNAHRGDWVDVNTVLNGSSVITGINSTNTTQNTNITALQGAMTSNNAVDATQTTNINSLTGSLSTVSGQVTQNTSDITTLNGVTTQHSQSISSLNQSTADFTNSINGINSHNTQQDRDIANVNHRVDDVSNRVSDLEKTQAGIGFDVRLADTKKWTVKVATDHNITRGKPAERVFLRFEHKLGKSYEERRIDELEARLDVMDKSAKAKEEAELAEVENNYIIEPTASGFKVSNKF